MKVTHTPESQEYDAAVRVLLAQGRTSIEVVKQLVTDHGISLKTANQAVAAVHYAMRDERKNSN